ncbi:MAG: GntR family transcriptional regulator [Clostridiales bacterium]|nr:GntR family transcriptional regulator [Clostridiales bacterium]
MTSGTLKDKVYAAVLRGIIGGEYNVESVLSEKQLTEKLQVSKSPVREALVELCSQGVLRSVPRLGYIVVRYTDRNIRDILQFRTMLECGCLRESFEDITPTQLCRLESVVESEFLFLSQKDTKDYWNGTLNFHLTLASFAENEFIYGQLRHALNTSMRAYLQLYWDRWQDSSFMEPSILHRQIVESIRGHDRDGAIELLRRDINTFRTLK